MKARQGKQLGGRFLLFTVYEVGQEVVGDAKTVSREAVELLLGLRTKFCDSHSWDDSIKTHLRQGNHRYDSAKSTGILMNKTNATLLLTFFLLAVPGQAEKPRAPLECRSVPGLNPSPTPGSVLLLGELHGNNEAPAFTANTACLALQAGQRVRAGLEIPHEETERVEAFLNSNGTEKDFEALYGGWFWKNSAKDGRTSQAMAKLIDDLRKFRQGGHSVTVTLFDSQVHGRTRDHDMAQRLIESIKANPDDVFIILTGNIHSRIAIGTPWDDKFEPMGLYIQRALPERSLLSLDYSWAAGTSWNCRPSEGCGAFEVRARGEGDDWRVEIADPTQPGKNGHHGFYHVGPITASEPVFNDSE